MQSQNAEALLLSSPVTSFNFGWQQDWSESIHSFIRWENETVPYLDASAGVVLGGKVNRSGVAAGAKFQLTSTLSGILELGTREDVFATSYLTGTTTLEKKFTTYSRFLLEKTIAEVRALKLSAAVGGSYLFPASGSSYSIQSGREYLAQFELSQRLRAFTLFSVLEYSSISQNTSLTHQERKELRTSLGFRVPLGEGNP
jgi:hypothetical protein